MIRLEGIRHHFVKDPVIDDVSFELKTGEVVALMGPNGSGKSTLLSMTAGLLTPTKGRVIINDLERRSTPENELAIRKQTAYLPAEPWLPGTMTGLQWMLSIGKLWDISTERLFDHIQRLLDVYDLNEIIGNPISSYSTGQKKKIALCGAIVTDAKVLLLDEPFAGGLDPSGLSATRKLLEHFAKRDDYTILVASPVPEFIEAIADRIAILKKGKLVGYGTIAELQSIAGTTGNLEEIYQKIVDPRNEVGINSYFQK